MLSTSEIIIRLVLAAVLGSLVGLERQRLAWAAGLRTHMLVCLGSALAMLVSAYGFEEIITYPSVTLDPSRVAAQVISGIGFIGAGTILFLRQRVVRGLTTAAGLWTVAAIGLAVGGGMYLAAGATTAITLVILAVLKPLEKKFFGIRKARIIHVSLTHSGNTLHTIAALLQQHNLQFDEITLHPLEKAESDGLRITLNKTAQQPAVLKAIDALRQAAGVQEVSYLTQ
jgi:putative Mg2+ transporter-C (MgtC) family protein